MIVVRLKGGLGNQLFQYAFGYVLARKNGDRLKIDAEWFDTEGNVPWLTKRKYELDRFEIPSAEIIRHKEIPLLPRIICSRTGRRFLALVKPGSFRAGSWLIVSTTRSTDYLNLPKNENILLNGYFDNHAAVYLKGYLEGLRNEFRPRNLSAGTKALIREIEAQKSTTSIHVRRTDQMHAKGHFASGEYYRKAIQYIRERDPETVFYVFSDDIDWCRKTFSGESGMVFATDPTDGDALRDFIGMARCKNNIIAYSTYSWWAAILNGHEDKTVITPEFYDTTGFLPEEWLVM